jgi:sulfide:quinone oxidoreductase
LFGDQCSESTARLFASAGIEFIGSSGMTGQPGPADYTVTLPLLRGPELTGVPTTGPSDFLPVDEHGRVRGLADVYAAGDAVDFPVKQGGLAAQQADTVAVHIAAGFDAGVDPAPFRPVLRGMLFTGDESLYMRSNVPAADPDVRGAWYPLWWPPTKIAGRYLAPYLFARDEEGLDRPPAGFIDLDIPLTASSLPG